MLTVRSRRPARIVGHASMGLVLMLGAYTIGCAPEERAYDTASSGVGGAEGNSSASSGTGGSGGTSSTSSGSGTGGGQMTGNGPGAVEIVNAGTVTKSPGYQMVFTLGQSSQAQGTMKGQSHRLQGGLIGANGSLK